jgi:MYXO-CTERM domain-containing protein
MNRTSLLALLVLLPLSVSAQQYPCATTLGTNCSVSIADKSSVTSSLVVQPGACASDARVVDVDVRVKLVHTAIGDLTLTLVHPSGKRVDLLYRPGLTPTSPSCLYDDLDLTFSDEAAASVTCNFTIPAATGTVKPFNPLSSLDGLERNGVWQLIIADAQGVSDGALQSWQLDLPCTLPPRPGVSVATGTRDTFEGGAEPATVIFTRDGDLTGALSVGFTLSGTAVEGLDYQLATRTIDFAAGEATATLAFTALADGLAETTESAVVTVASGEGWVAKEPSSAGVNFIDVTCGDGLKTGAEACDDGNLVDGDGCNAKCEVVPVPEPTPTPTKTGCGCSSTEASGLALLALAAWLRRRARS